MRIMINIAPPTEAPIIMGSFDFGSSSLLSVVSVVEIKGWTLKMVAFTDPPMLDVSLSTMAFRTSFLMALSENPWGCCI